MVFSRLKSYLQLTKPTITILVLVTGGAGLVIEASLLSQPLSCLLVMLGLFLTGGSANALNQYFEREIDAKMSRTRRRRPLPQHKLGDTEALIFSILIGVAGVLLFLKFFNFLSAALALGTILFYGFFYTLWLKPNTCQNIVIGGAAGAMAPVISWAAAAGNLAVAPGILFMIIFLWTPPHFWALAMYLKEDYEKVNLPMMPIVKGDEATSKLILWYSLALVAVTLTLPIVHPGVAYPIVAVVLGWIFIKRSLLLRRTITKQLEQGLFRYSIVYLLALFMTIIVEGLIQYHA